MREPINKLEMMRKQFDSAVSTYRLSASTTKRYRSWIRRFLIHCRKHGQQVTEKSAYTFLTSYSSAHTRRQGYFALRFFFTKALEKSFTPEQMQGFVIAQKQRRQKATQRKWL